jgi:transcription factor STE12
MNRFLLPSTEYVTCIPWNLRYHITGTDIVRALAFRFEASGGPVINMKTFEEAIYEV